MIDPHIFRAYDIRGKAHTQLSVEACTLIGQAFGTVLRRLYKKDHPEVVIGRDMRTHSPELEQAVVDGLMASGCRVVLIGQTPSPVNYFTICKRHADGGIQVTASHNPKEDNGLKLQVREAEAYSGDDLQKFRRQIEAGDVMEGNGTQETIDGIAPYADRLAAIFKPKMKPLRVVVDSGNGVTGPVNCRVLRGLGFDVVELFTEPDGTFPNHPADPSKHATLKDLREKVKESSADLGIAFDGDGDRLGVVDEQGKIWSADYVLLLLAKDLLERHAGSPVIFTVSNSSVLDSEIRSWGGKPVMTKVGHSFVEHAMRQHDALLGGEQSGHFFCAEEYIGFDDALVAALRILSILSAHPEKTASEQFASFPAVFQEPEMRPFCLDGDKARIIASVTEHFSKEYPVITLDGVRIDFGNNAWAGIRQSNTSPCISICMEARSAEKLDEVKKIVLEHLKQYPEIGMKDE